MYEEDIEWEEHVDPDTGMVSSWRAYNDFGVQYAIKLQWRKMIACYGDEGRYHANPDVADEQDFFDHCWDYIDNHIPLISKQAMKNRPPEEWKVVYEIPTQVYDEPYWDNEEGGWAYATDTPWVFYLEESYSCFRFWGRDEKEWFGRDIPSFEAAEKAVRSQWDTFIPN